MNQTAQTSIIVIAIGLRLIWLAVELRQRRRFPIEPNSAMDKHSGKAWDISQLLELVGLVLGLAGVARFGNTLSQIAGLVLLSVGMAIRFAAINELGNFFSSLVTIRANHRIVDTGPYRFVRHPAYAGALLAHLGLGLSFGSWISLGFSTVPFFIAALYRMRVEEAALGRALGREYADYVARTRRLIPKIY